MLDSDQPFKDIDFLKLDILFNNITGGDYINISNDKIEQILQTFYSFRHYEIHGYPVLIKQLHVLQLFAKVLFGRNPDLTIIYNTITTFLSDTRLFLYRLNKAIYRSIKEKTKDLPDYYLVFFNNNEFNFQKDCLDIFFKSSFLDIDILDYQDCESLIDNEISTIYYQYLKTKTNGDLKFEDANLIDTRYSIRSQIYEDAFRQCKIKELILSNSNSTTVLKTYHKFKNRIMGNELQKFYIRFYNINPNDKELALTMDTDFLINVKDKLPLVYQVISALHIHCESSPISERIRIFRELIYKSIYESLYIELINFQSEDICKHLCNDTAVNISNSLFEGYYINPISLRRIAIFNVAFVHQLKEFISEVFRANSQ